MRRARVLLGLLLLAACGNPPSQAPRVAPPAVNETAPAASAGNAYVVQPGETIYTIAQKLHLSVRSLIDANQMQPPFQVWAGQKLVLPGSGFYIVNKGDNLTVIARKTSVPFATLARMNGLSSPYVLQVGQKLLLPAAAGAAAAPSPTVAASAGASPSLAPTAAPVYSQQTASAAPQAAVTVSNLPPPGSTAPAAPAPTASAPVAAAPVAAPPVSAPISNPTQTASLPPTPLPEPPKSGKGFLWPVKGEVIAEYGTTSKGQHNDGINIAAARGTPVLAAEAGVVAYAGNELRGFGNLLLIKHEGGWMTAYAHNDALLVKRGDVVKRGQKIAKVGDSGGVSQPQLHFEVRQGTRAVDPATLLGGSSIPATAPLDPSEPG